MNQKKAIKDKLFAMEADIFNAIPQHQSMSLLQGIGGLPILYLQLYKNTRSRSYLKKMDVIFDQLIDSLQRSEPSVTFCEGIAGVSLMLNYMHKETSYNKSTVSELIGILDTIMFRFYRQHNAFYDLDFLHGSAGILVAWLSKKSSSAKVFTEVKQLMPKFIEALEIYLNNLDAEPNPKKIVNCGMAHGLISQIMILSMYSSKFGDKQYLPLIEKMVSLMIAVQYKGNNVLKSVFPSIVNLNDDSADYKYIVPLGWCYGDTTASLGLAKAGEVLQDKNIVNYARQIALRSISRETDTQAIIYDASFCHGSASIAHSYNKWRWQTNDPAFSTAYEKWIGRTLELCQFEDGIGGFKKFEGDKYTPETGLLDGAAGVAMVLSDYVYDQKSTWDSAFLLS
jgi:hypothetical protein